MCTKIVFSPTKENFKLDKEIVAEVLTVGNRKQETGGSTVYKKKLENNVNMTTKKFDFEFNSEETTTTNDELMKEVIAKLVRKNIAVLVKRKNKDTGAKKKVPRRELKEIALKKPLLKLRDGRKRNPKAIPSTTATRSYANIEQFVEPSDSTNLVDQNESTGMVTSVKYGQTHRENVDFEEVATYSRDKSLTLQRRSIKPYKTHQRTTPTSISQNCQSVLGRVSDKSHELLCSSAIYFEFSKVDPIDETKDKIKKHEESFISTNNISNNHQLQALYVRETSVDLQDLQSEKIISVKEDIKNFFGFNDSDKDDEETIEKTMPSSVIKNDGKPTLMIKCLSNFKPIANCETKIFKKPTLQQAKTVIDNRVGNFFNANNEQTTQKTNNQKRKNQAILNKVPPKRNCFQNFSIPHIQPVSGKIIFPSTPQNDSSRDNNVGPALFETDWPKREYKRVCRRKYENIMSDEESEGSDMSQMTKQQRHKKAKPKAKADRIFEKEMKKFVEEFNAHCREVDNYNLVIEVSQ